MFIEKILESKKRKISQSPVNTNRASELGFPCSKYHILNRTRWQEKTLHSESLQLVFDIGNDIEQRILKDLMDAGVQVVNQQRMFEWKEYQITGHIDGFIIQDGKEIPLEIKSSSPFVYDKINSVNDLLNGKYVYLRKYPVQLNLYLLMSNCEKGLFIFKNKVTGAMKEIWMNLDYELGEQTLQMVETVNDSLKTSIVPVKKYDEKICNGCFFSHICLPERDSKDQIKILDDIELQGLLDEYFELQEQSKRYDEIDSILKEKLDKQTNLIVGNYFISGKEIEKKSYDVPKEIKDQYLKTTTYWKKKIERN